MTVTLDASQLAVVDEPPDGRVVVIAGAGRGKTEVVAARIQAMIDEYGLSAADEILVLTFSRAAVRAVEQRFAATGLPPVRVSTFDSFASRLLYEVGSDVSLLRSYDARVRAAGQALADEEEDLTSVDLLRHLLLDEVQDLVGDRAALTMALVARLPDDCGVTALADPLQAIYDWQRGSTDDRRPVWQTLTGGHGARELHLECDYRARGDRPRAVVELGDLLRGMNDGRSARSRVRDFYDTLLHVGPIEDNADLIPRDGTSTAVLCRRNGDALAVSRTLRERGVDHVLRRPLDDVGAAGWVAAMLSAASAPVITATEVREHAVRVGLDDPEEAWVALKVAEGDLHRRDSLALDRVRQALRNRSVPLPLMAADDAPVVVSTVHRAKGLEFDRVVVVDETSCFGTDDDHWAEARVGYVALSRAREEILRCSPPGAARRVWRDKHSRRQSQHTWRGSRPWCMEVVSADTSDVWLTGDPRGARAGQDLLALDSTLGQSVEGRLDESSHPAEPSYDLVAAATGVVIGRTSETFGLALCRTFGRRTTTHWPSQIDGMTVSSVETVAGDPTQTRAAGLGEHGFWLVPRLGGLARPDFQGAKNE